MPKFTAIYTRNELLGTRIECEAIDESQAKRKLLLIGSDLDNKQLSCYENHEDVQDIEVIE